MKPHQLEEVCAAAATAVRSDQIVVSILAGVSLGQIEQMLTRHHPDASVPRMMSLIPNLPCLVGEMASGYCCTPGEEEAVVAAVGPMLDACGGVSLLVDEAMMPAVTGLSGGGPEWAPL